MPVRETRSKSPPSAAVRLTRSQLAKKAELEEVTVPEPKSLVDGIGQMPEERETMKEERNIAKDDTMSETGESTEVNVPSEPVTQLEIDAPASPALSAVPNVIAKLRTDTPAKRSTSNKENVEPESMASPFTANYDVLEDAVIAASTPPGSTRQSTSRSEDPITGLDELDDAVENVRRDIPEVQTSPEKPKANKEAKDTAKKQTKRAEPVVRTTKASQARISMSQSKDTVSKQPSLGRPRPSTTLGRASGVRQSTTTRAEPPSKRITSSSSTKDSKPTAEGEKKEAVIPHSKPRPISLSFPTPPPAAKSTKAPTQSTFQLPGEAIAAKLKAAREARQQKEAEQEEEKKRTTFKARPVPAGLSKAPSVRQTNASKARESMMNGKESLRTSTSVPPGGSLRRANSVAATTTTTRPTAPAPRSRVVSKDSAQPVSTTLKPSTDSLTVKKRPSTALASMSKPRTSFATIAPTDTITRVASNPTKGTAKGKEVFNRAAAAKDAARTEKLEKEAAAKKARADAADRGRQASREWAEKQKLRKMAKQAADTKKVEETPVAEAAGAGLAAPNTAIAEPVAAA